MLMRKAHEPRQASRRGLNESDGSGRALLAVRHEARRRSVEVRKYRRDRLRFGKRHGPAHQAGGGTGRRTKIALVRGRGMLMPAAIGVLCVCVVMRSCFLLVPMPAGCRFKLVVAVLGQLSFSLDL